MTAAADSLQAGNYSDQGAPRIAILLPAAYLIHLAEEWFFGFLEWTPVALGYEIGVGRFVAINAVAAVIVTIGTLEALRNPRIAWLATSFAALFLLNGVLHALGSLGPAGYSPGGISGLILYVPISVMVLRKSMTRLSRRVFVQAIGFGVFLHALVALAAFS